MVGRWVAVDGKMDGQVVGGVGRWIEDGWIYGCAGEWKHVSIYKHSMAGPCLFHFKLNNRRDKVCI